MTDIRVNSVLPAARTDSAKSSSSGSDFIFSFQSVSAADVGSSSSARRSDDSSKALKSSSSAAKDYAKDYERTDNDGVKQSVSQSGGINGTDFEKAQSASHATSSSEAQHNTLDGNTAEDNGFKAAAATGTEHTVKKADDEFSELQNQVIKTDGANLNAEPAAKKPMLDLNSIIEGLGNLDAGDLQAKEAASIETEENLADTEKSEIPQISQTANNAPVIDLDRILAGLNNSEQSEEIEQTGQIGQTEQNEQTDKTQDGTSAEETDGNKTPELGIGDEQTTVPPQLDLDKILEGVEGDRDGAEAVTPTDGVNGTEAGNAIDGIKPDDDKIAVNVGNAWDALNGAITKAVESLEKVYFPNIDGPHGMIIRVEFEPLEGTEQEIPEGTDSVAADASWFDTLMFSKFARVMSQQEKPVTLEELKSMLANAMKTAIDEMNSPDKQQEELEEEILEFLLKFLEKMNEDEDDKDTTVSGEEEKGVDLGILLQIIENMIDEVRDGTQNPDSEESASTKDPAAAVEGVENEYGVNDKADVKDNADENVRDNPEIDENTNADKFTDTDVKADGTETEESKNEHGIAGAAEGLNAAAADMNAAETVDEAQDTEAVKAVGKAQSAGAVENYESAAAFAARTGLTKVDDNAESDDLNAKAAKVLSKQNRNGSIRTTELSDEFAELRKLIDDMKKTHEDEEEPEEENDDEEKEVGVGGKGVKGDDKSEIIRAVSIKSTEPGEAAVAKASAMERSGAKEILSQIASEILNNAPKEKRTVALVMTLTPENLGKVTLKITEQAGRLNVVVTAHNKETADILASRMDGLQEALKDSGTQLEKYQVVYGPEQEAGAHQQSYEGSSKNPYVRDDNEEETDKDGKFAELLQEAV